MKRIITVLATAVLSVGIVCGQEAGGPQGAGSVTNVPPRAKDWSALLEACNAKNWSGVEAKAKAYEAAYPEENRVKSGWLKIVVANAKEQQGEDMEATFSAIASNDSYAPNIRLGALRRMRRYGDSAAECKALFQRAQQIEGGDPDGVAAFAKLQGIREIQAGRNASGAEAMRTGAAVKGVTANTKAHLLITAGRYGKSLEDAEAALEAMDTATIPYDRAHYTIRTYLWLGGDKSVAAQKAAEVLTSRIIDSKRNPWSDIPTTLVSVEEPSVHSIEALYRYVSPVTLGYEAWTEFILSFRVMLQDLTNENRAFFAQIKKAAEMVD